MTELEEFFLHSKPSQILVQLNYPGKDHYTSEIAKEVDCTYSHAVRIIKKMESHDLIQTRKEGRKKVVELTEKGQEIVEPLSELLHKLQQE